MIRNRRPARSTMGALVVLGVVAVTLTLGSPAASANNLTATDGRSTVESIDPAAPIAVSIIGGDAAVRVRAEPGHEVVVLGYQDEPYLRIAADGTTSVNRHAPARLLNRTRDGGSAATPTAIDAAPDWVDLEGSSAVVWHDHRIHSMAALDEGHEWEISLLVDGQPVLVRGVLLVESPPSPLPWTGLIVVTGGIAVLIGRRRPDVAALALAATAAATALVMAVMIAFSTPVELGRDLLPVLLTVSASIICGIGALLVGRARILLTLASAALSAGFLATMLRGLSSVVPMPMFGPPMATRLAVSIAVASTVASVVLVVVASGHAVSLSDVAEDRRSSSKR